METAEIIEKIQVGLKNCSIKHNVGYEQIRIKIRGGIFGVDCYAMNGEEVLKNSDQKAVTVSISDLVGINPVQAGLVSSHLKGMLSNLAQNNNINASKVNAQIFTKKSDFEPSVYLYEGTDRIKEITVEELTSM